MFGRPKELRPYRAPSPFHDDRVVEAPGVFPGWAMVVMALVLLSPLSVLALPLSGAGLMSVPKWFLFDVGTLALISFGLCAFIAPRQKTRRWLRMLTCFGLCALCWGISGAAVASRLGLVELPQF